MTPLESLGLAGFVLGLVAAFLWVIAVALGVYAWWRYVYAPWKTMRADIAALNTKIDGVAAQVSIQRVDALSNEEVAYRESRLNARQRARSPL